MCHKVDLSDVRNLVRMELNMPSAWLTDPMNGGCELMFQTQSTNIVYGHGKEFIIRALYTNFVPRKAVKDKKVTLSLF
jgi:hypothetical protein